jgi:hypothetical protein
MSDEFDHSSDNNYSSFWPLLILVISLLIWFGYEDYILNNERSFYSQQIQGAGDTITAAKGWQGRYAAIIKDLSDTSAKDTNAAPIFQAAVQAGVQAGLLQVHPNATNSAPTSAEPASMPPPAPASTPSQ